MSSSDTSSSDEETQYEQNRKQVAEDMESESEDETSTPTVVAEKSFVLGALTLFDPTALAIPKGTKLKKYVKEVETAGVQSLLNKIFDLPSRTEVTEIGRIATLPKSTLHLPREKPLPKPKDD